MVRQGALSRGPKFKKGDCGVPWVPKMGKSPRSTILSLGPPKWAKDPGVNFESGPVGLVPEPTSKKGLTSLVP
jgi:hypothetical protein